MAITVSALSRYLIKSCRGEDLDRAALDARGFIDDRRFKVVDPEGIAVTQRQLPRMAQVVPRREGPRLVLSAAGRPDLAIDLAAPRTRRPVNLYEHHGEGEDVGDAAAAWLSTTLGRPLRLVRMPDDAVRRVDPAYAVTSDDQSAFNDDYPLLLVNQASLAALNARLAAPVTLDRFRANVVIAGAEAFAEDAWKRIRIGAIEFAVVKPCARCTVITVDQATSERGAEPLRTLAAFRTVGGKVMFGQNLIHRGLGTVRVGDGIEVVHAANPA